VKIRFKPNTTALAANVVKAFGQLEHDLIKDRLAEGLIVMRTMWPREACHEIRQRFPHRLSPKILGVVRIGRDVCMVVNTDIPPEKTTLMEIAARRIS
jgi:hypothetical protein